MIYCKMTKIIVKMTNKPVKGKERKGSHEPRDLVRHRREPALRPVGYFLPAWKTQEGLRKRC